MSSLHSLLRAFSSTSALRALCLLLLTWSLALRPALAQGDTTAPSVVITTPADNTLVSTLAVNGTATDSGTNPSGIASVGVQLTYQDQYNYPHYWNGSTWGSAYVESTLAASLTNGDTANSKNWSVSSLPQLSNLPNNRYRLTAKATDVANNVSSTSAVTFFVGQVDNTGTLMSVTTPSTQLPSNSGVESILVVESDGLGTIAGQIWDPNNPDGSPGVGVQGLMGQLQRFDTYQAWDGTQWLGGGESGWTPLSFSAPDVNGKCSWSVNTGLTEADLPPGFYRLHCYSNDFFQNGGSHYWDIWVLPHDVTPPTTSVTFPSHGQNLSRLTHVDGVASDPIGPDGTPASGLGNISAHLARLSDDWGWNSDGRGWQPGSATPFLPSPLFLSGLSSPWSFTAGFPPLASLPPGDYEIRIGLYDAYANFTNVKRQFHIVANTHPTAQAQSVSVGASIAVTLSAIDAEGDEIESYRIVTQPAHGTLSGTAPHLTYTPESGYSGSDSFTFAASDWQGEGTPATVGCTIIAPTPTPTTGPSPTPSPSPTVTPTPTSFTLDARIQGEEGDLWQGDGIVNTTAAGQEAIQDVAAGQSVTYRIAIGHSGPHNVSQQVRVLVADWQAYTTAGWSAHFFQGTSAGTVGGANDITTQIVSTLGWSFVPQNGQDVELCLVMTAPANAVPETLQSLLIGVQENTSNEIAAADVVKATARIDAASSQPDIAVRPLNDPDLPEPWTGENITQGNPKLTVVTKAGTSQSYEVKITNIGTSAKAYVFYLPPVVPQWTVTLLDALRNGTDVSAQARAFTGWSLAPLEPGQSRTLRLEVTGTLETTALETMLVVKAGSLSDRVTVEQGQQAIAKLQWTNDGLVWTDVTSNTPILIKYGTTFGMRAVGSLTTQEWPGPAVLGPLWYWQDSTVEGQEVWFHAYTGDPTQVATVTASFGNSAIANIRFMTSP